MQDFLLEFNLAFDVTKDGYLKPLVYACQMNWGETTIYHDNMFVRVLTDQWIRYTMVIIKNSIYFLGTEIFDGMAEPVLTKFLWYYEWYFVLDDSFEGQNRWDLFTIDVRNTRAPIINQGSIDFWISGAVKYSGNGCDIKDDPTLDFIDSQEKS